MALADATWGDFLAKYGSAVWDYWYAIVLGGALFIVDIIERVKGKDVPFLSTIAAPVLFLTLIFSELLAAHALYVTQDSQYASLKSSYDELDKQNKTQAAQMMGLHGQLGTIEMMAEPRTGTAVILLNIAVTNTGNPTIAQGFNLQLTYGGTVYPQVGLYHPEYAPPYGMVAAAVKGKSLIPEMRFTNEDQIFEKARTPIPSGGYVNGWAFYRLDGVKSDIFTDGIMVVDVAFTDVYGHMYHAKQISRRNPTEHLPGSFLPGSSAPFERSLIPKGAIIAPAEPHKKK
jgi:hypothetical protein